MRVFLRLAYRHRFCCRTHRRELLDRQLLARHLAEGDNRSLVRTVPSPVDIEWLDAVNLTLSSAFLQSSSRLISQKLRVPFAFSLTLN
jgi:hypothetical protein